MSTPTYHVERFQADQQRWVRLTTHYRRDDAFRAYDMECQEEDEVDASRDATVRLVEQHTILQG